MKAKTKGIIELAVVILLFVFVTYLVQNNLEFFQGLIEKDATGIAVYFILVQIAIIFAPLSSVPLIPIMSNIWGWQTTAIINFFAWTFGCVIVFLISRTVGVKILKKLVFLGSLHEIEKKLPTTNVFFSLIFLRMIVPVDILSYALGLLTKVRFTMFFVTTVIGIIPGVILWSYAGTVSPLYQLIIFFAFWIAIMIVLIIHEMRKSNKKV